MSEWTHAQVQNSSIKCSVSLSDPTSSLKVSAPVFEAHWPPGNEPHTRNKAESHWMSEGECEHRVILGKLGLTPFRGKQQSDRRRSHRQSMNWDRKSDCGRDVVTSADLCDTHMNVSISDLKSDSVRFIKPLVSWRGDPAAGLQWSKGGHWGGPQNYLTGTQHGPVLLKKKQCRLLSQNGTQRGYSYHNQFKLLLLSMK